MAHKNKSNVSPYKNRGNQKPPASVVNSPQTHTLKGLHRKPLHIFSLEEANERLFDIFRNHRFEVSHEERLKLAHFYNLLMHTQEQQNFTRLLSLKDVAIRHFIDSLIVAGLTKLQFPLLDLGTGPGLPGIPLKIRHPNDSILLAEGVQKRVEFLKSVRSHLKLEKLDIVGRNINNEFYYPLKGVITRAVEDISNTLRNVSHALELGGRVYFMKGPGVDPEIGLAQKEWSTHYRLVDDIVYNLPETPHQRRLVIYEKISLLPSEIQDMEAFKKPDIFSESELKYLRNYMKDSGD